MSGFDTFSSSNEAIGRHPPYNRDEVTVGFHRHVGGETDQPELVDPRPGRMRAATRRKELPTMPKLSTVLAQLVRPRPAPGVTDDPEPAEKGV